MTRLLYAGPPLRVLHEECAKRGGIDLQAPVTTACGVDIRARRERVWELLASPLGWEAFDPAIHDVRLDGPVAADTTFTWGSRPSTGTCSTTPTAAARTCGARSQWPGPLLTLIYSQARLRAAVATWLTVLKTAAERE